MVGPFGVVVAGGSATPAAAVLARGSWLQTSSPCPNEELLSGQAAFDVVLSDMAPDTNGHPRDRSGTRSAALVEEALGRAERLLAPLGAFLAKGVSEP